MASCQGNFYHTLKSIVSNRIWWLAVLSILGFFVYFNYEDKVFPSASINLKVPRIEITRRARELANSLGYSKPYVIESTQFTVDNQAKTFLEYEFGSDKANQLMKEGLPIWFWRTRLCREHEQEQIRIWLNTAGQMQAFNHELENDKYLPSVSKTQARLLAEQFVEKKTGLSLASYTLTKSSSYRQSQRTDYSFTWQDNKHPFNDAKLRIHITVSGDLISHFNYYLYVPESFQRKFSTLRSSNQLLQSTASIFYSLLQITSVFIFFWAVSTKRIRWRFAIYVAGIMTLVDSLDSLNDIAGVIGAYNTQELFLPYLFGFVIECATDGLSKFVSCLILAGAAELVYRASYPRKLSLENVLTAKAQRTKSFINGNLIGHLIVGINLGWIVFYYFYGKCWHIWCPLGIENYQILSTVVPFFSAIATGIGASITEELMYRVLALSLFQRLTRSFWVANVFQAVAWGFMHSSYPQEPAYARGAELTVIGLIQGWILRRYGLLPCLITHYLFDALVSVKALFSANDLWLKCSALVPLIPFCLLLIVSFLKMRKRGFRDEKALQNRTLTKLYPRAQKNIIVQIKDELTHGVAIPADSLVYVYSLSKRAVCALMLLSVTSLLLILPLLDYEAVNRHTVLSKQREEIITTAKEDLMHRNIKTDQYKVITTLFDNTSFLDMQYIYENKKLPQTIHLAEATKQGLCWKAKFFKPLDPKEYVVWMNLDGKVISFTLIEPEDSAGANLSEDAAREKAEAYLKDKLVNWQPYKFDNSFENKHKARTDYTLTFTVPDLKVGEADFKVAIDVLGNVVSSMESGYDLPDHWLNERNKRTIKDEIFSNLRTAFNVCVAIAILLWSFGLLKAGHIKWQTAYYCAIFLISISFIQHVNSYPQFYISYSNTEPLYSYVLRHLTSYVQVVQNNFLYNFCSFALAFAALNTVAPKFKIREFIAFLIAPFNKEAIIGQKRLWLKAWLLAFCVASAKLFISIYTDYLHIKFSPTCPQESLATICDLSNMAWPALAILADALISAMKELVLVAVLAGLYKRYCRNFSIFLLFIIAFNIVKYSYMRYWQDYVIDVTLSSVWEISMWYFIVKLIGVNPLTYFLIGFIDSLLPNIVDLIQHGWPIFAVPVILGILLILMPLIYAFYLSSSEWYRKKKIISVPS